MIFDWCHNILDIHNLQCKKLTTVIDQANSGVFGSSGGQKSIKILFEFYQSKLIAWP